MIDEKIIQKIKDLNDPLLYETIKQLNSELDYSNLSIFGKIAVNKIIYQSITLRKRYKRCISSNPNIKYKIDKPIFVMGLPRSGTTYLHNLLIDAFKRDGLKFWELSEPFPIVKNKFIDIRLRKLKAYFIYLVYRFSVPKIQLMHPININSYEECWHLFKSSLNIFNVDFQFNLSNFGLWIKKNTIQKAYLDYKKILCIIINNQKKNKLVLKCPDHLFFYDNIKTNFPDAFIIWIHRDPVRVITSYSAMMYETQKFFLKKSSRKEMGALVLNRFYLMVNEAMKIREINDINIIDVNYIDLKKDFKSVLRKISEKTNLKANFLNQDISINKFKRLKSKKNYNPDEFSLDKKKIYKKFNSYMSRFKIKKEY